MKTLPWIFYFCCVVSSLMGLAALFSTLLSVQAQIGQLAWGFGWIQAAQVAVCYLWGAVLLGTAGGLMVFAAMLSKRTNFPRAIGIAIPE